MIDLTEARVLVFASSDIGDAVVEAFADAGVRARRCAATSRTGRRSDRSPIGRVRGAKRSGDHPASAATLCRSSVRSALPSARPRRNRTSSRARGSLLAALSLLGTTSALAARIDDRAAVKAAMPQRTIVDHRLTAAEVAAMLKPVEALYGFWNNGSQALLRQAIAPTFTDHTLPQGRPQGPNGPMAGAKAFMGAVPDLRCTVVLRIVAEDRVVSQLRFTGHFRGTFQGAKGRGQAIDFIAFDIVTVQGGQITDISHLEDNLTFLKQVGLAR